MVLYDCMVGQKIKQVPWRYHIFFNSTTDVVVWGTVSDAFFGTTASISMLTTGQVLTTTQDSE